jgi:hypothetical protein
MPRLGLRGLLSGVAPTSVFVLPAPAMELFRLLSRLWE